MRRSERRAIKRLLRTPDEPAAVLEAITCLAERLPRGPVRERIHKEAMRGRALAVLDKLPPVLPDPGDEMPDGPEVGVSELVSRIPELVDHLPERPVLDDLAVMIDIWKDIREFPPGLDDRPAYQGVGAADLAILDDLVGRLERFREKRRWYAGTSDLDPAVATVMASQAALDVLERLAVELPAGMIRDDIRILLSLWERFRYGYDAADRRHPPEGLARDEILALVERLASLMTDDGAQWAILDVVEMYRPRDRSREPLFWDTRADLLAGRIDRKEAISRLGLESWTRMCATFDHTTLRQILGEEP